MCIMIYFIVFKLFYVFFLFAYGMHKCNRYAEHVINSNVRQAIGRGNVNKHIKIYLQYIGRWWLEGLDPESGIICKAQYFAFGKI